MVPPPEEASQTPISIQPAASAEGSLGTTPPVATGDFDFVMAETSAWANDKRPLLGDEEDEDDENGEAEAAGFAARSGLETHVQHKNGIDVANVNALASANSRTDVQTSPVAVTEQSGNASESSGGDGGLKTKTPCSAYVVVIVLFCVNLLNYSDRYTIAANLTDIQKYFHIENNNSAAGLLQTIFIVGYMLTSPIFGYLGDRYSRKLIVAFGITFWSGLTLAGSFVPQDMFWLFLLIRGMVGIGEASYVSIAATLIGDLFVGNRRTRMLMVFYFAIPVGSGLGYISGSLVAQLAHDWRWALRFTPPLGVLCVFLIMVLVKEPKRGQAETGEHTMVNTSYAADIRALVKNMSYISSTLGLTSVCWVTGALALWAVKVVEEAYQLQGSDPANVGIIFGVITMAAGFVGVAVGTTTAQFLRRKTKKADPLVCAAGMLLSAPFLFIALEVSDQQIGITWTFVFIAETLICLNWALVPDILLAILIPTRRSSGNAIQMLISHLLGDALSPYLVGAVSDAIRNKHADSASTEEHYMSLVYSLYMTCYVTALGGGFFLWNALYFEADKKRVETIVENEKLKAKTKPMDEGVAQDWDVAINTVP